MCTRIKVPEQLQHTKIADFSEDSNRFFMAHM